MQAAGFQFDVDDAVTRFHVGDGSRWVGDHVFGPFGERRQKGLDGCRVVFKEFAGRNDGVAVQLDAVFGVGQHGHVCSLDTTRFQVQQRGEGEAGDSVHITAHQHGLAQRGVHGGPLHAGDVVGLGKDREGTPARIKYRSA